MKKRWLAAALGLALPGSSVGVWRWLLRWTAAYGNPAGIGRRGRGKRHNKEEIQESRTQQEDSEKEETLEEKNGGMNPGIQRKKCRNHKAPLPPVGLLETDFEFRILRFITGITDR